MAGLTREVAKYKKRFMRFLLFTVIYFQFSVSKHHYTRSNQRLGGAGDNDRRSKRFCSNAVLCAKFHVTDGQDFEGWRSKRAWSNCVLCIPFILSGSPNECWLHTCDACVITTWRLGLRAPLVACNNLLVRQRNPLVQWFHFEGGFRDLRPSPWICQWLYTTILRTIQFGFCIIWTIMQIKRYVGRGGEHPSRSASFFKTYAKHEVWPCWTLVGINNYLQWRKFKPIRNLNWEIVWMSKKYQLSYNTA